MKVISHILKDMVRANSYKNLRSVTKENDFPWSSFWGWYNGKTAPVRPEHRAKLFKLTGHPLFEGPLTREKKRQLLEDYVPSADMRERADRVVNLIRVMNTDLQVIITQGDVVIRDYVRSQLTSNELIRFSTGARALSSEDALRLMVGERTSSKKGGSE